MAPRRDAELSSFEHGVIGAMVGSTEQAIMRPSVFWKTELQQERFTLSRALNPRYCYRGLPVAVMSIAPVTCIQYATTHACRKAMRAARGDPTSSSELEKFVSGGTAGIVSTLVQSPVQLVEVNQQNHGGGMAATARRVLSTHGVRGLYRGGSMTATRECIFCTSYIALAPFVKGRLMERWPEMSEGAAVAAAAVASGSFGALLSHPADTLKTRLQGSLFPFAEAGAGGSTRFHQVSGPREALRAMREQGPLLSELYRGVLPRVFRVVCCTYIYSSLTKVIEGLAREWKSSAVETFEVNLGRAAVAGVAFRREGIAALQCEDLPGHIVPSSRPAGAQNAE